MTYTTYIEMQLMRTKTQLGTITEMNEHRERPFMHTGSDYYKLDSQGRGHNKDQSEKFEVGLQTKFNIIGVKEKH